MKQGDIFTQKTQDGRYVFGRVLLDLSYYFDKKIMDTRRKEGALSFFQGALLIEILDLISETKEISNTASTKVGGVLMNPEIFTERKVWEKVGFKQVLPSEIDFPEYIVNIEGKFFLSKGEVRLKLPINHALTEKVGCRGTVFSSSSFSQLAAFQLGIKEDMNETWRKKVSLAASDLRFITPDLRKALWTFTKEDYKLTYAELAGKYGFDVSRLIIN